MSKINLLPRKVFELNLEDGSIIKGQFGTWALKRFTDIKKIPLSGVAEAFTNLTLDDAILFILCGVEYMDRLENRPHKFNELILCEWIDYAGGVEVLATIISHASDEDAKEKKTEQEPLLSGQELSDMQPVQA